jgi:hypothetical protein
VSIPFSQKIDPVLEKFTLSLKILPKTKNSQKFTYRPQKNYLDI